MIYIFTDGRTLYDKQLLQAADKGKYIEVTIADLPTIEEREGFAGIYVADLEARQVAVLYMEMAEEEEQEELPAPAEKPSATTLEDIKQLQITNLDMTMTVFEEMMGGDM